MYSLTKLLLVANTTDFIFKCRSPTTDKYSKVACTE